MVDQYFYAQGRRQALVPAADLLAVDRRIALDSSSASEVATLPVASTLPGGLILVKSDKVSGRLRVTLEKTGSVRAVYRSGDHLMVPLPEVRVEFEEGRSAATLKAVRDSHVAFEVTGSTERTLRLRPQSGKGEDALALANYIHEHARPTMSSARMVQVVAPPAPRPP